MVSGQGMESVAEQTWTSFLLFEWIDTTLSRFEVKGKKVEGSPISEGGNNYIGKKGLAKKPSKRQQKNSG